MNKVGERVKNQSPRHERDVIDLQPLSHEVPNIDAAVAEIARYSAELTLPQGTIHVLSDIHGEDQKLRHVINNASGTLRAAGRAALSGAHDSRALSRSS